MGQGSLVTLYWRLAVDEEQMQSGHWSGQCFVFPTMLWHCWMDDKKDNNRCHLFPKVFFQNK